jgi:hypothetical protein
MSPAREDTPGLHPELIVVAHPEAELHMRGSRVYSSAADAGPLEKALTETGAQARPLHGVSEARIQAQRRESPWDVPDLSVYYHVAVDQDHEAVAARLNEQDAIAGAYVKPAALVDHTGPGAPADDPSAPAGAPAPPMAPAAAMAAAAAAAAVAPLAAVTPDFSPRQSYLNQPPDGVSAKAVWDAVAGGAGAGAQVIVVGGAWRTDHEDLVGTGGVIAGTQIDAVSFRNHGTAMVGIVRANRNDRGVIGVAPACTIRMVATFGLGTAAAIRSAADNLPAGGIILIEWQRPGPGSTGLGSAGFIPLEWWPDDFDAIKFATDRNITVISPAGNGSISLDDPVFNIPAPGFPATWKNPFDRTKADCHSILVGAGAPVPGSHGTIDHGPNLSRLAFSNFGTSLDVQGWGADITTIGFGDLQNGPDERAWYTDNFGGTSGAAAMVAGVVASMQGIQLAGGKRPPLTPTDVRAGLRQTGKPQADGPGGPAQTQRIGNRPDLIELSGRIGPGKDEAKESKEAKDNKENKDGKEAKEKEDKEAKEAKEAKESTDDKRQRDNKPGKDRKDNKEDKGEKNEGKENVNKESANPEQDPLPPQFAPAPGTVAPPVSNDPVQHFIPEALRPELNAAALRDEPDLRGRNVADLADELRPPEPTADHLPVRAS